MNSLIWLVAILLSLVGAVIGLAGFIVWIRHSSLKDFIAHRRGREIMEMVVENPKPRVRVCSCCGGDLRTAKHRPHCMRNPANAQKSVSSKHV